MAPKTKRVVKTIWQLDKERPTNCLNFGTRKECGKPAALQSGCKIGPCAEALAAAQRVQEVREIKARERAETAAAPKRATPRTLRSHDTAAYLEQCARENAVRPKGTREGNWVWHTEECCTRVWRPLSFGCTQTAG